MSNPAVQNANVAGGSPQRPASAPQGAGDLQVSWPAAIANPLPENPIVYGPLVARQTDPSSLFAGAKMGVFGQGGNDPNIGMAFFGAPGDWDAAFQIEMANPPVSGTTDRTIEGYFQIDSPAEVARWPFLIRFDRDLGFMTDIMMCVGQGMDSFGNVGGQGFVVSWDNGAGGAPMGLPMFSLTTNRLNLWPVSGNGATNVGQTRVNLRSAAGNGSAISWTWNAANPEGIATPTLMVQASGANFADLYSANVHTAGIQAYTLTKPSMYLYGGIQLGDASGTLRGGFYSTSGAPGSTLGNNGDLAWNTASTGVANTTLYQKRAGVWVGIL